MIPTPIGSLEVEAAKLVAQLQQSVGANHPKVKELQGRIAAARQNTQPTAPTAASKSPGTLPTNVNSLLVNENQEVQQQIAQLRKEYEAADGEARQLARQHQTTPDGAQKNEAQRADLRHAVQRAFTARQSLLRAELLEMHDKLLKTQRSIDLREQISDQIIERRVENLLNLKLEWEGNTPTSPPLSKAADAKPTDTCRVLEALNNIRPGERLVEDHRDCR